MVKEYPVGPENGPCRIRAPHREKSYCENTKKTYLVLSLKHISSPPKPSSFKFWRNKTLVHVDGSNPFRAFPFTGAYPI